MRVLLVCAAGMSTSMLTARMKHFADPDDVIDALPVENVGRVADNYDVFLLGPQIRYQEEDVAAKVGGKPVAVLDMRTYGKMDGQAAMMQARAMLP